MVACDENGTALLRQRNKIRPGDRLELLLPGTDGIPFTAEELRDESGEQIPDTRRADMVFQMRIPKAAAPYTIVRSARTACSREKTGGLAEDSRF